MFLLNLCSVSFGSIEEEDSYTSLKAALRDNVFSMSPTLSPKLPAKDNSSGSARYAQQPKQPFLQENEK